MDAFALLSLSVVLLWSTNCVNSLELKSVEEGNCGTYPSLPINMTWVFHNAGNVKYLGGASKYNVYSGTAQLPDLFPAMREFAMYYDSCFGSNFNLSSGIGSLYGFGELLGDFKIRPGDPETEPTALYLYKIGQPKLTIRLQVTLTDYKSFMFFANCWMESNKRAWSFGTFKPNPDKETIRMIEAHAEQLGFQRKNFAFFRYDTCPAPKEDVFHNAGNLKYFGGGSKYNVYSGTAQLPNLFPAMREFELYYDSCFGANLNLSSGIGSLYGFGELLGDYKIRPGDPETEPTALYFYKIGQPKLTIRHQVTLTDYKSFMFFANCWMESNKRAWSFGTFKPNPDKETIRMIEAHAEQLGFQRKNFAFFRYDTCPTPKGDVSRN